MSVRQKIELNLYMKAFKNWLITTSSGPVVCMQTGPETRKRCSSRSRLCWGQGLDPVGLHLHQVGDNRLRFFQVLIFTEFSSLSLIICLLTSLAEVNQAILAWLF